MTRIRSKRALEFEALEGRLALSTGMGLAAASQHAAAMVTTQALTTVPVSFKASVQISGTHVAITNLTGSVGPVTFKGSGSGTLSGKTFTGGSIALMSGLGNINLKLGPSVIVKVGSVSHTEVSVTVVSATGALAHYAGVKGTLTNFKLPTTGHATVTFAGTFKV